MDWLGNLLGLNAGKSTMDAARENLGEINRGGVRGQGFITAGVNGAKDYLSQMMEVYAPLSGATGMYADALGINGAEGGDRATEAFRTNPGYEFAREQGLDALGRRASSLGRYQSGGTEADFIDYATGTADKAYGSWLDRLMGASGTAMSGTAGALGSMADLETSAANARLGLDQTITGARIDNNNMFAQGGEQNAQGWSKLGGNLMGLAGKALGGFGGF